MNDSEWKFRVINLRDSLKARMGVWAEAAKSSRNKKERKHLETVVQAYARAIADVDSIMGVYEWR